MIMNDPLPNDDGYQLNGWCIDGGKVEKSTKYLFTKYQIFDQSTSSAWKYQFENQISFCRMHATAAEMAVATVNVTDIQICVYICTDTSYMQSERVWCENAFAFSFRMDYFLVYTCQMNDTTNTYTRQRRRRRRQRTKTFRRYAAQRGICAGIYIVCSFYNAPHSQRWTHENQVQSNNILCELFVCKW